MLGKPQDQEYAPLLRQVAPMGQTEKAVFILAQLYFLVYGAKELGNGFCLQAMENSRKSNDQGTEKA
jgi:hypothetical protein